VISLVRWAVPPEDAQQPLVNLTEGSPIMQFDKQQILEMLQQHGTSEQVSQAEQDLPDQVDTDQHAGLLNKLGVSPQELLTKMSGRGGAGGIGGLGDKLGM